MLTVTQIKGIQPAEKPKKYFDGGGLYLLVMPTGARYWRLKYRFQKREKLLSLGTFPSTSLAKARKKRDEARELLDSHPSIDPSSARKALKAAHADTFEEVAAEWLAKHEERLAPRSYQKSKQVLGLLYPRIGRTPVSVIQSQDLLSALRVIESQGKHETTKRCRQTASRVFRYAISIGKATYDPSVGLVDALTSPKVKHRSAIVRPEAVGAMLRTIDSYSGLFAVTACLRLLALLFTRPSELRLASWSEFDLNGGRWVIPAERMKMRAEHVVPLAKQAVEILDDLREFGSGQSYLFVGLRAGKPISENTLNYALRGMGIGPDQHTAHGFRSTASTLLHELGFPPEVIELQLAHAQRNQVAAAYNRSARLAERGEMMQAWADYLDSLRRNEAHKVVPYRAASPTIGQ